MKVITIISMSCKLPKKQINYIKKREIKKKEYINYIKGKYIKKIDKFQIRQKNLKRVDKLLRSYTNYFKKQINYMKMQTNYKIKADKL